MSSEKHGELESAKTNSLEITGIDHDFVKRYRPVFLGKGGEQLVYGFPRHPTVVAKANMRSIQRIIDWNQERHQPAGELPSDIATYAEQHINKAAVAHRELTAHFGAAHVPRQRMLLAQVPVTPEILQEVYKGPPPVALEKAWTLVTIQQRVPELARANRSSLACGYAEQREQDPALYERVTARTVQENSGSGPLTKEDFFAVQKKRLLKQAFERAEQDPGFKQVLTDCVRKMVGYSTATGQILDLVGEDNIAFIETVEGWTYKLVDALDTSTGKTVERAREVIEKVSTGATLDAQEKNVLLNTINFVRTVNGLAELLGLTDRIHLFSDKNRAQPVDFLTLVR